MTRSILLWGTLLLVAPLPAQRRVDLTGAPIATIAEPFTSIGGVREVPGNRAITTDFREVKVLLLDFARGTVQPLSRRGGGPGEYQFPTLVLPGRGTDTWIVDVPQSKVHIVSATGAFTGSITPPPQPGLPTVMSPRAVDRDGRFYFQGPSFDRETMTVADSIPLLRWDPGTQRMETIGRIPTDMPGGLAEVRSREMNARLGARPFVAQAAWAPLPDGRVAVVHPSPYRIDVLTADGRAVRGPAQPYAPIRVTAADHDAFRAALPARGDMPPIPEGFIPATKPPFSGEGAVRVTPEGEIWVLRNRAAADPTPTYDIFDATGKLTGRAMLKPNSRVVGFGTAVVYVARQDPADDLRYLEKYAR